MNNIEELGKYIDTREGRARFIEEVESGIYDGRTADGLQIIILNQQHEGMTVYTEQKTKPNWMIKQDYDNGGYKEAESYLYCN